MNEIQKQITELSKAADAAAPDQSLAATEAL